MQMLTISLIYITDPNAWLCRIQREDFETVLGLKAVQTGDSCWTFFPTSSIIPPGIAAAPSTPASLSQPLNSALSILIHLWLESSFQFRLPLNLLTRLPNLTFYPLPRP